MDFPSDLIRLAIPLYAIYSTVKYYKSRAVKEYTAAEVAEMLEAIPSCILVLDVRTPAERAVRHIPGSAHIPFYELSLRINELEQHMEREIICCCSDGSQSRKIAFTLHKKGFNAANMLDGMNAWNSQLF